MIERQHQVPRNDNRREKNLRINNNPRHWRCGLRTRTTGLRWVNGQKNKQFFFSQTVFFLPKRISHIIAIIHFLFPLRTTNADWTGGVFRILAPYVHKLSGIIFFENSFHSLAVKRILNFQMIFKAFPNFEN